MPRPSTPLAAAAGAALAAAITERRGRTRSARERSAERERLVAELTPPPGPSPEQVVEEAIVQTLLERPVPPALPLGTTVTDLIHARLDPADRGAVEAVLDGHPQALFAGSDEPTRRRLTLNFAAAYGLEDVLARAGMTASMPPEEVHAMARGPVAAGGDAYLADLVAQALESAGLRLPERGTILDFGASSGRVLRMFAAARPDLECLGCDPNEGAVAWAAEHLPMARFFVSPQRPPLELADGSVAMAYAISIWSHFAAEPALAWLDEMHRVLEPGGALVLSTHGLSCLTALLPDGHVSRGTASAAAIDMIRTGHHFVDVFGPDGDWGVKDAEWGNAYLTLDWLLASAQGRWAARLFWPAGLAGNQDVIVLQRLDAA